MSRVKRGVTKHARHKRVLKLAKGYRASYSKLYRVAKQQTLRSGDALHIAAKRKAISENSGSPESTLLPE